MTSAEPEGARSGDLPGAVLQQALAEVEQDIEERSGVGSALSEGRDVLQQELERQSAASSVSHSSEGTMNSARACYGGRDGHLATPTPPGVAAAAAALCAHPGASGASPSASGSHSHTHSHSGSSTSFGKTSGSVLLAAASSGGTSILDSLSQTQRVYVDNMIANLTAEHGQDLLKMRFTIDGARVRELGHEEDKKEMSAKLARMQKGRHKNENLQEELKQLRVDMLDTQDARDNVTDQMAGMEARHEAKASRHAQDVVDIEAAHLKKDEELQGKHAVVRQQLQEELAVAMSELAVSKKKAKATTSERDVVQRNEASNAKAHELELQHMLYQLNAANREISRRDRADVARNKGNQLSKADDFKEQHDLEELLGESRDSNRKLNAGLTELRLQLLTQQQTHKDEVGEMQGLFDTKDLARSKQKTGAKSGRGPRGAKLHSIGEEDEDLGSQAASVGQVSSEGAGVGDLGDFEDDEETPESAAQKERHEEQMELISSLYAQLDVSRKDNKHLTDDATGNAAENLAKVTRLLKQISGLRNEHAIAEAEITRLAEVGEDNRADHAVELDAVQRQLTLMTSGRDLGEQEQLKNMEHQEVLHATNLDELSEQLAHAMEAKRLASARLEDMKQELAATEARHARVVADLNSKLLLGRQGGPESEAASIEMVSRLQSMEEERNVLRNEFDCAKVHWQAALENEQRFHAVDIGKRQDAENQLLIERTLRQQAEEKLAESQKLLAAFDKSRKSAEHEAHHRVVSATTAVSAGPSWLTWFGCPSRRPHGGSPAEGQGSPAAGEPGPSCQAVVWQVLSSMRGVNAVLCAHPSLKIMDATKSAFALWGSAALRGTSLASLVSSDASAEWFKEKVAGSSVPGSMDRPCGPTDFWLLDMGGLEFRGKLGLSFDSSVICARLPLEPRHARAPALVMVVEPMAEDRLPQPRGAVPAALAGQRMPWPQVPTHPHAPASGALSVTSDDITADDSASNVNRW